MDESTAKALAANARIHVEQIVREWWEMIVLKEIFDSPLGASLVFKGGTALRLAYGSPRFSEDLDFDCINVPPLHQFEKTVTGLEKRFPEIKARDICAKHFTLLAEYGVRETWMPQAFQVKVEVSKRKAAGIYNVMLISSKVSNLEVLGNVSDIGQILKEKREAIKTRVKPRDVFDLWYIGQKLKMPVDISGHSVPEKALKQELRKYLPAEYWKVLPELTKR